MAEVWRPAGEGAGEGAREGADAVPLRVMLAEGAQRMGFLHPMATAKVFACWRELVGDQVAARCDPASVSRGVLKVWAATPTWAVELRYLAPEMIRRVNAGVGTALVHEVKVSVRPPDGPAAGRREGPARAPAAAPSKVPPREGPALNADELVRGISDERLAAATKRALLAAKTHPKNW